MACVTILVEADDAGVVKVLENSDLVVNRKDGVLVSSEELFLEDLDGCVVLSSNDSSQVHLGGVSLTERLEDLVSLVEDWV